MKVKDFKDKMGDILQNLDPSMAHESFHLGHTKDMMRDLLKEAVTDSGAESLEQVFGKVAQEAYNEAQSMLDEQMKAEERARKVAVEQYHRIQDIEEKDEDKQKSESTEKEDGIWRTVMGRKVFIPTGTPKGTKLV